MFVVSLISEYEWDSKMETVQIFSLRWTNDSEQIKATIIICNRNSVLLRGKSRNRLATWTTLSLLVLKQKSEEKRVQRGYGNSRASIITSIHFQKNKRTQPLFLHWKRQHISWWVKPLRIDPNTLLGIVSGWISSEDENYFLNVVHCSHLHFTKCIIHQCDSCW